MRMRARASESEQLVFDNVFGLVLAALALVYLTYAMLRPEKF